jgi:glycosyltransferase involved in cell wall biosynthesis
MKAGIYTPYLDTLGGGERYMLSGAQVLIDAGYTTYLQGDESLLEKARKRFGLPLEGLKVVDDIKRGDGYDVCLWLSDGSIPTLKARKNILHFQRPFYKVQGKSLINRAKFFRINSVIVNSKFTKNWIDREYPVSSHVLYPPVDISQLKSQKKDNLILYVGRFSQLEQSKGQDTLVEAFKNFHNQDNKTYKLVLAGGSDVGRTEFVDLLKERSKNYPIEILENIDFIQLKRLYSKARFFWSAAGFGVDGEKHPEKLEHFGMTIVEAMASGAIPLAFDAGGHREIVKHGVNGCLWENTDQLIRFTQGLIENPKDTVNISLNAIKDSQEYSYENFEKKLLSLL